MLQHLGFFSHSKHVFVNLIRFCNSFLLLLRFVRSFSKKGNHIFHVCWTSSRKIFTISSSCLPPHTLTFTKKKHTLTSHKTCKTRGKVANSHRAIHQTLFSLVCFSLSHLVCICFFVFTLTHSKPCFSFFKLLFCCCPIHSMGFFYWHWGGNQISPHPDVFAYEPCTVVVNGRTFSVSTVVVNAVSVVAVTTGNSRPKKPGRRRIAHFFFTKSTIFRFVSLMILCPVRLLRRSSSRARER